MIKKLLQKIKSEKQVFSFKDRIRLGDGVFDTMLVIIKENDDGLLQASNFFPEIHFERLLQNAQTIGIKSGDLPSIEELQKKMMKLVSTASTDKSRWAFTVSKRNKLLQGHYALNTIITRGQAQRGLMPPEDCNPTIEMHLSPCPDSFPPINAIIAQTIRRNEGSPLSQIKSCNYGDNIMALIEAREANANEAILLNNAGFVTCASAGNIFCYIDNQLVTPPLSDGVMDGVTRKLAITKYSAIERSITANDLENAAGIYITNSIRGAMPVLLLNGKTLPEPSIKIDKDFHITWHSKH